MKWIDYRKALGIGFEDREKARMFRSKMSVLLDIFEDSHNERRDEELVCRNYFIEVCEVPKQHYAWYEVKDSIVKETDLTHLISKAIALTNCFYRLDFEKGGVYVESYLRKALDDLNILYDIFRDDDGVFVFPKGAKELDEANVSIPFEWLKEYPDARKAMADALKEYYYSDNYSNVADLFRKALERFFQSFFGIEKTLENLKSEYGKFMRDHGVSKDLSNNFETVLQLYTNFNNNNAKHADKTIKDCLEFIMYQTGNIIRFMISLDRQ